jgi:hypothetical protein
MPRLVQRLERPRFVLVLACLLLLVILAPVLEATARPGVSRTLGIFALLVPVLAVSAAGDALRHRRIAVGLALVCAALNADTFVGLSHLPPQVGIAVALALLGYTTARLLTGVLRSDRVSGDVIAGAVAAYLMIGLTWAMGYGLIETLAAGSIRPPGEAGAVDFPTLLYFSFITLLTIGYGDVTPVSPAARTLTVLEGLVGVMFTTVVLAALVAAHLSHRNERAPTAGAREEER